MTELRWRIQLAGGEGYTGKAQVEQGQCRVHPELPGGVLEKVTARVHLAVDDGEKIFMNGYQTWTVCGELGKKDALRGLNGLPKFLRDKYGLDRYGDYHFISYPNRPGLSHGFSWCYFRKGEDFRLVASLDERPGYTVFRYNAGEEVLSIERDCAGVEIQAGAFGAFDLFFAQGTEEEVFDAWFRALGIVPRTRQRLIGYSSWYNHYGSIREESILNDLEGCRGLLSPGDLFQIDDGWQPWVGDWMETAEEKFPHGLKPITEKIHAAGFRAGLWLAPFVCEKDSRLYREHPEWLLQVEGEPWGAGSNWSGAYALDLDNPQVTTYLEQVFYRVFHQWDFDLVKLDFLYAAAPYGNRRESRAGRMIRAMELLRKWCGDKLILGCGVPVMPAFGLVDYCRVSCDVGLDWDDKWYMHLIHRERVSTRQAILNTAFRRQLNGRAYLSDPDVFFLREENLRLTEEEKEKLFTVNALLGGVLLTSDDPGTYGDKQRQTYRRVMALRGAEEIRVEADQGLEICYRLDGEEHRLLLE